MSHQCRYRYIEAALARVATNATTMSLPFWPDPTGSSSEHVQLWRRWLEHMWSQDAVAAAIEVASPVLARRVREVCGGRTLPVRQMRRLLVSMTGYGLRMTGRATPFGLFAGVAPVRFGSMSEVRWGGQHHVMARADAVWLGAVLSEMETHPRLLRRLSVVANNTYTLREDRLVLLRPQQVGNSAQGTAVEVSVRRTRPVEVAVHAARLPILFTDLIDTLAAEFIRASQAVIEGILTELVVCGILLTSLRPPMTVIDALGYVVEQLGIVNADDIAELAAQLNELRAIHADLTRHNSIRVPLARREIRAAVSRRMVALCDRVEQPLAVDLRLGCDLVLPEQVAHEAELAASALVRLTPQPLGAPAWRDYHTRFLDRYGVGALVPVLDLVNADTGLGFPAGYRGIFAASPPASLTSRDVRLLTLAQQAVMDGCDEVVLDDQAIDDMAVDGLAKARMPPHLELCCQVHAATRDALDRGDFGLVVVSVSRAAGTTTGRFLGLLDAADRGRMVEAYAGLPTADAGAWPLQMSCPPLCPKAGNVARVPAVLPDVVSLAEYCPSSSNPEPLEGLAVGADAHRLYLMSLTSRRPVEPRVMHAVEFRNHTHPLVRFLCEITTAQSAACIPFSWGAASTLPFQPRIRYRRTVLAPARWNLDASTLPRAGTSWPRWSRVFSDLQRRLRLPDVVVLGADDRRIQLDVRVPLHLALVRSHLDRAGHATLHEAPDPVAFGWCGGRPHEVVLPMASARPTPSAVRLRPASAVHTIGRDHGHLPGASDWLFAKLYANPDRQATILIAHLPALLATWDHRPDWWFVRYRDSEPHLRLRFRLSPADPYTYGQAVQRVGTWAANLRRLGLATRLQFDTYYPETGRYGTDATMAAAESVFAADSAAAVAQLTCATNGAAHPQALVAASIVDMTAAFTGSFAEGARWLTHEVKRSHPVPAPRREIHNEAIRLANPRDGWAALRATPGGDLVEAAWQHRRATLVAYRDHLAAVGDIEPAAVLPALLHVHHLRMVGSDPASEQTCQRLARAAALSWLTRTGGVAA